ncbi:MAG: carboxypeptidase-like regulatory domain-containing protein [Saprospiraceae bacterium]|nr:carboxypeptidase-like regulatory domain-containing protein [Saprospiraceae bacterium]
MKKLLLLYFLFGCFTNSFSQSITGKVTNIFGEPLAGANVKWKGQDTGTATDDTGTYEIPDIKGENRMLVFSYLGFKTDSIHVRDLLEWNIQLIEDNTLTTVDISAKKQATRFADGVIKAEVIGTRELERAACCSLAGCFNTNASVDAATTNVVTDAKELRILGLSGVYNQILIDGMPLVQGTSYTFGSSSIPGTMIEEIFVSKGANSVVQGYESITGQINIMPKSPEKSEILFLNALANSFGESQYNVNYMHKKSNWSNFTNVHATLPAGTVDSDNDGFQDVAQVSRVSLFNKWMYDNPENQKLRAQIGVRFWNENRIGGQTEYEQDIHRGSGEIYGQQIDLTQFDVYTKVNYKLGPLTSIIWESSAFHHDQESIYGQKIYQANQRNIYSNFVLDHNFGANQHNWKTGISIRENNLTENISFIENPLNLSYAGEYLNDYTIPGLFSEAIFYIDNFTIMGGIRADKHGQFGWKITPRMLIRAEVNENTDLRITAGKGFRRVHPFSEQVMMLASNRDITFEDVLAPEEAINLGVNLIQKFKIGNIPSSLVVDGYLTFFQNQVFPDFDREVGQIFINNFSDKSYSRNIQVENKWEFSPQIDFKWAYNYQWTAREIEGKMIRLPLIPLHNVLSQLSVSTKDNSWQTDFTFKWIGSKQLPNTEEYPVQYQQEEVSPSYSRIDIQLTKRWSKFELYAGIENITNFRQNFPILGSDDPFGPFFDSSFNWGPTKGREFYLGFRYKIRQ